MEKFKYFEIVKILSDAYTDSEEISNLYGFVQTDGTFHNGEYIWGVYIEDKQEVYMLKDSQLSSTGKMYSEQEFYDGTSITVKVNPETGESDIVE